MARRGHLGACVFVAGRAKTREWFDECWGWLAIALLLRDLGSATGLLSLFGCGGGEVVVVMAAVVRRVAELDTGALHAFV